MFNLNDHIPAIESMRTLAIGNPSGMCAKLRTVAARNNRDHPTRSLYYCLFAPHTIFLFFAHIPFVVNQTINATPPERLQQYHSFWRPPWILRP